MGFINVRARHLQLVWQDRARHQHSRDFILDYWILDTFLFVSQVQKLLDRAHKYFMDGVNFDLEVPLAVCRLRFPSSPLPHPCPPPPLSVTTGYILLFTI